VGGAGDVPERLDPPLGRQQLDVLRLGALEEAADPRAEGRRLLLLGAPLHVLEAEARLEAEDPRLAERDVHVAPTVRPRCPLRRLSINAC
jgi:hypothetical protein